MSGQRSTSDGSTIVAKSGGGSFEEQPNIIQPTLVAISLDLRAIRESQADLERQLDGWMSKHGDVLLEVKLQHQQLRTMIQEVAVSRHSHANAVAAPKIANFAVEEHQNDSQCPNTKEDIVVAVIGNDVEEACDRQPTSELRDSPNLDLEKIHLTFPLPPITDPDASLVRPLPSSTSFSPYGRANRERDDANSHIKMERIASMKANIRGQRSGGKKKRHSLSENAHLARKGAHHCAASIAFDVCFGCLIIANAVLIGAEVEYNTNHDESTALFVVAQYFFCIMFIGEFTIRIIAAGLRRHFFGHEWIWSWFDLAMIFVSLVEVMDSLSAGRKDGDDIGSQMLRIVRMARLARIVRVLRFSPQLMVMVFMIIESAKALVYAFVLLAIILYVFSICFTIGATNYLNTSEGARPHTDEVQEHYGSIFRSIYSLFKSVTNGQGWAELLEPIVEMGAFYASVFLLWISFAVLALLNIVTGFFVDGALTKCAFDRDLMVEKELSRKRAVVHALKQLFEESDTDGTGNIELDEFVEHLKNDRVAAYLSALRIDTSHLTDLFMEIDVDGSGTIDINEFVENMQHVMGASGLDQNVQRLLMESKVASERERVLVRDIKAAFSEISDLILSIHDALRQNNNSASEGYVAAQVYSI